MSDIMLEALRELRNQNKVSESARIKKPRKPVHESINEDTMLDRVKARASKRHGRKEAVREDTELNEDIQDILDTHSTDLPATPLPQQDVLDFVDSLPAPADHVPPVFFKAGYMREVAVASKFEGKRG